MAKRIMQFRYYGENSPEAVTDANRSNQPSDISMAKLLKDGGIFKDYLPFTQLGIQTLPGTRVYLNNNEEYPIIIGNTGIYELELEGISEIGEMHFDKVSLENINKNPNGYLIIDVICNV